jgi:hypothetical protein
MTRSTRLPSLETLTDQAQRLRVRLEADGRPIGHSQCLELQAHQHGFKDWNTLHAAVGNRPPPSPLTLGDRRARDLSWPALRRRGHRPAASNRVGPVCRYAVVRRAGRRGEIRQFFRVQAPGQRRNRPAGQIEGKKRQMASHICSWKSSGDPASPKQRCGCFEGKDRSAHYSRLNRHLNPVRAGLFAHPKLENGATFIIFFEKA